MSSEGKALRLSETNELLLDSEISSAQIRSFLGAPIIAASGITGWLCLVNRNGADDFSEADERLAVTLATQISVAYENARLYTEAETANRAKDEFLATLSHELRTPLTAILGWSHIIRENQLDESQLTRGLETIERNARSQSQLIDDLLDVSRIITGKLEIEPRVFDLIPIIDAAIDSLRPTLQAKKIQSRDFYGIACVFG